MPDTKRKQARKLHEPCSSCGHRRTLAEIARELGVSRQRVHQLLREPAA
jgi:DNA-directed RNA polymerase sigma subunit (sigma70/sigma32)